MAIIDNPIIVGGGAGAQGERGRSIYVTNKQPKMEDFPDTKVGDYFLIGEDHVYVVKWSEEYGAPGTEYSNKGEIYEVKDINFYGNPVFYEEPRGNILGPKGPTGEGGGGGDGTHIYTGGDGNIVNIYYSDVPNYFDDPEYNPFYGCKKDDLLIMQYDYRIFGGDSENTTVSSAKMGDVFKFTGEYFDLKGADDIVYARVYLVNGPIFNMIGTDGVDGKSTVGVENLDDFLNEYRDGRRPWVKEDDTVILLNDIDLYGDDGYFASKFEETRIYKGKKGDVFRVSGRYYDGSHEYYTVDAGAGPLSNILVEGKPGNGIYPLRSDYPTTSYSGYEYSYQNVREGDYFLVESDSVSVYVHWASADLNTSVTVHRGDLIRVSGVFETNIVFWTYNQNFNIIGKDALTYSRVLEGVAHEDVALCDNTNFNRNPVVNDVFQCIYKNTDTNEVFCQIRRITEVREDDSTASLESSVLISSSADGGGSDVSAVEAVSLEERLKSLEERLSALEGGGR